MSVTFFCSCVPCSDSWPNAQTDIYISLPLVAPHELCLPSSYHNFAMPYQALALLDMSDLFPVPVSACDGASETELCRTEA